MWRIISSLSPIRLALGCFLLVNVSLLHLSLASDSAATKECAEHDGTCVVREAKEVFDVFGKWIEDFSREGANFLAEHVFGQQDDDKANEVDEAFPDAPENQETEEGSELFEALMQAFKSIKMDDDDDSGPSAVEVILERARLFATAKKTRRNFGDIIELFHESMTLAKDSFDRHFGHIEVKSSLPISLWYWIEREDEHKNPSWKRKKHRFYSDVDLGTVHDLHKMLYLSHLSYVDKVEDIQAGLEGSEDKLELIYAQLESFPGEPAHFIALRKEAKSQQKKFPWDKQDQVEVILVVRGTKEFGDVLSDVIMDATDYRGGKSHDGVAKGGKFLAETHIDLMKHLLEVSGRQKIKLTLTGHSLGAGAAAIAAIEFNEHPSIDAEAIGFGCPALLSKELSESAKDFITTVVADSDVVPRMSGAAVANTLLDAMSFDWTNLAINDTEQLLEAVDSAVFFDIPKSDILSSVEAYMDKHDRPFFDKVLKERAEPVLIPPGTCIHVYRDGVGFSGKYTPCTFFDSVDVTRTMLLDHMTDSGYHRALLQFVRDSLDDLNFNFHDDLLAVPA